MSGILARSRAAMFRSRNLCCKTDEHPSRTHVSSTTSKGPGCGLLTSMGFRMSVVVMAVFGILAALVALGVALALSWPAWLVFLAVPVAFNGGVLLLLGWFWFRDALRPEPGDQPTIDATDARARPVLGQTR
jgi:hypothetical protein